MQRALLVRATHAQFVVIMHSQSIPINIQTKQSGPGQWGVGNPSARCIAYLALATNKDRWLLPVGANIAGPGTEREGTIITQTHKHISRWWMVKNLNTADTQYLASDAFVWRWNDKHVQELQSRQSESWVEVENGYMRCLWVHAKQRAIPQI